MTTRLLMTIGVVAAVAIVALGWYVLDGTFNPKDSDPSDERADRTEAAVPAPGTPGAGAMRSAGLLACVTEARTLAQAKRAAAVLEGSGLEESLFGNLSNPYGEYFQVNEDDTVTTLKPLPPGCIVP